MANWKKMAEAFGKSLARWTSNGDINDKWKTYQMIERAGERGDYPVAKAFEAGDEAAHDIAGRAHNEAPNNMPLTRLKINRALDADSDKMLQADFDKAFEEALEKHGGDGNIDAVRKSAIEMLKSGQDIGDVLRFLKGE